MDSREYAQISSPRHMAALDPRTCEEIFTQSRDLSASVHIQPLSGVPIPHGTSHLSGGPVWAVGTLSRGTEMSSGPPWCSRTRADLSCPVFSPALQWLTSDLLLDAPLPAPTLPLQQVGRCLQFSGWGHPFCARTASWEPSWFCHHFMA